MFRVLTGHKPVVALIVKLSYFVLWCYDF